MQRSLDSRPSRGTITIMFNVCMLCYLWDLEDEGIDEVLDRIQGQVGVDGVAVVAASGPLAQLRRRPSAQSRLMRSRGGFYFQPDDAKYAATRCKPVVSNWLKARNPLSKVAEACVRRGLPLRAVVDTRRIGRLAARYPAVSVKSAFGDVSPGCASLANRDFVELLRALIGDLASNYSVATIELRHLDRLFDTDLLDSIPYADALGPAGKELFSVSFCESSMQSALQAGVDAEAARRSAQVTLSRAIDSSSPLGPSLDALLGGDPILAGYVAHQRGVQASVLRTLSAAAPCELALHVTPAAPIDDLLAGLSAESRLTAVMYRTEEPGDSSATGSFDAVRRSCSPSGSVRCEAVIPAWRPDSDEESALVRTVQQLANRGADGVTLDHYGIMTDRELTAAKQGVRFAKRSRGK
ncbi:MAG: hypothetical protein C4523_18870 [Myxococcales bacterium]|nr:MAG: hypothetical protein C4523_18870 [Myxococcales bacterium]